MHLQSLPVYLSSNRYYFIHTLNNKFEVCSFTIEIIRIDCQETNMYTLISTIYMSCQQEWPHFYLQHNRISYLPCGCTRFKCVYMWRMAEIKSLNIKSLEIRHVELKDLEFINKLMEIENYDVGILNLRMYSECSSTKLWKCVNLQGEIIAIDLNNLLPNDVAYDFSLIINPIYRGLGI